MKYTFKKISVTVIVLLLMSLLCVSSYAVDNKITVVYTDWFPYTYEEKGKAVGFEIETFQAVMKNMNIEAEFAQYPWKRCLLMLEKGMADALISLLFTPEREKYTYFPKEHISISKTVFFAKSDTQIRFNGVYEDLKDYRIGVIMGFSYGAAFDNAKFLNKEESNDAETLIKMLLSGRFHLGAENQAVISASAQRMGVRDKIKFLDVPIHTQQLYAGFSKAKGLKTLCDSFSEELARFKQTEEYTNILKKYGVYY